MSSTYHEKLVLNEDDGDFYDPKYNYPMGTSMGEIPTGVIQITDPALANATTSTVTLVDKVFEPNKCYIEMTSGTLTQYVSPNNTRIY